MSDNRTPNYDIKQVMETFNLSAIDMASILRHIEPFDLSVSSGDIYNYASRGVNPPADKYKKIMAMREISNINLIMRWRK